MLLTNGTWLSRETYEDAAATTLNIIPSTAPGTKLQMGVLCVKYRVRFAGLHDPTIGNPRLMSLSLRNDDTLYSKTKEYQAEQK
jgi:hypothetical protein